LLPNVGKTLTAQKAYLTSEERSVKNRKQIICLMQCLILNILAATKNVVIIHHEYFITLVPDNEYNATAPSYLLVPNNKRMAYLLNSK
jgi:hypothetical protein